MSLNKYSFIAKNWNDYISQGDDYEKIHQFWLNNFNKLGAPNNSYSSWQSWYVDKKRNSWGGKHKGPVEVLNEMKSAISGPTIFEDKPLSSVDSLGKSNDSAGRLNQKLIGVKPGASLKGIDKRLVNIANMMGQYAEKMNFPKPIITSGVRNPKRQVIAMARNWKKLGSGTEKSRQYLLNLYGDDDMASNIDNIFRAHSDQKGNVSLAGIDKAEDYIKTKKPNASPHLSGRGLDFRLTENIYDIIGHVMQNGYIPFKLVKESDHAHIQVS